MSTDVQVTEQIIATLEHNIKVAEAIERLDRNSDFKLVVTQGFLRDECIRYVDLSGDPDLTEKARLDSLNIAQAGGHFKRYIESRMNLGRQAQGQIVSQKNALDEMRAEAAGE
jgi:hypothetical protein